MRRTHEIDRKYFRYAAIAFAIVFLMSSVLFAVKLWEKSQRNPQAHDLLENFIDYDGKSYVLKEQIETFLILGLDKFENSSSDDDGYENDKQADFLMLLVFDNKNQTCSAIHINRDTIVPVNLLGLSGNTIETVDRQIALAHTEGNGKEVSCRNTAESVSTLFKGMKVNHYVSLTMDAIPVLNDSVGGVELEVLDDFTGIDDTLVKGSTVSLRGAQALTYVRARQGMEDSSNVARMERQRQYMSALFKKLVNCIEEDEEFLAKTALELPEDSMVSDRSNNQLQHYAEKFAEYEYLGIETIDGRVHNGEEHIEFYPDRDKLLALIVKLFYEPIA